MANFKNIFILAFVMLGVFASAQVFQPGDYRDGIYDKENSVNRKFIPYTYLREGDVQFSKRVWRNVDLREKINQPLYLPTKFTSNKLSLMQLVVKGILDGSIIAFEDEEFLIQKDIARLKERLVVREDSVDQDLFDDQGNPYTVKVAGAVDSTWIYDNFQSLEIKEDWFFDKQKSVMEVRIVGLGFNALMKGKEDFGPQNQFYIYFPACRPYFAATEVYNTKNDAERRTFDDIFWKRQFNSNIIRESNVFDRTIDAYSKGIDALLENDRIKKELFQYEHDFWHF